MELENTTAAPAELLEQVNKAITTVLVGGQSYKIGSRDDLEAQLAADESGPLLGRTYMAFFEGR